MCVCSCVHLPLYCQYCCTTDRYLVYTCNTPVVRETGKLRRKQKPPRATKKIMCVFVCVFSSHSFWTSSSLDVPAGVTQEEGHTGFLIYLLSAVRAFIFLARRIHSAIPFLRRP